MTMRLALLLALPCLAGALSGAAMAQTAVKLEGDCEKLVIAGLDVTTNCKDVMTNTVTRGRASFDFSTWDGRALSFSGNGFQQDRTEETDALQPINLVIPSEKTPDGVAQGPLLAVGQCKFSSPSAGKTAITCEATSAKGRYEGVFVTDAKTSDAKAPDPKAPGAKP